jgi:GR25 family glycosyltransferase involved in LPS biosynthesis
LVINLPHNEDRLIQFKKQYKESDLNSLPLQVFVAVDGKKIEIKEYVTKDSYDQIMRTETEGYRLKHKDLTRGAVGCYLSHISIYKQLLQDPEYDFYIIFEDDAVFNNDVLKYINYIMSKTPKDWDIILFGRIRCKCEKVSAIYERARYFWGLFGYAINKEGARKVVDHYEKTGIDMQIDSAMSKMSQQDQLVVYGVSRDVISQDSRYVSNIQKPLKKNKDIDPFSLD